MTLMGRAFYRSSGDRLVELPDDVEDEWRDDVAVAFGRQFWGGYVGCLLGEQDRTMRVFRDPSGAMSCYYIRCGRRLVVASHLDLLWRVHGRLTLDRGALIRRLLMPPYRDQRTCLREVRELLPGDEMTLAGGRMTFARVWSPWDFTRRISHWKDHREATDACRQAVLLAVAAWGREIGRPLLYLSGGLDSSIVAVALHLSGINFDAVTVATRNPAGDERGYARLVAERLGFHLYEAFFDADRIDLRRSTAAHLPRPVARAFNQEADRIGTEIASFAGTSGFINGGGGDNVFCHLHSIAPLIDAVKTVGIGPRFWRTLTGLSQLTHTDIGTIVHRLVARIVEGRVAYRWPVDTTLLEPAAAKDANRQIEHPWLTVPPGTLPGSAAHVALMVAIQNFLEGHSRELVSLVAAPLISQPVTESCLRTPSWMWVSADGRDRSVAREAFSDWLPTQIVQRRSKATPDPVSVAVVERRRPLIREILLDGYFAAEGVLDAPIVEQLLRDEAPLRAADYTRLIALCDIEAWIAAVAPFTDENPLCHGLR